ncbi:hypothetical protein GGR56DRAFT_254529 [Xylariaceae sp. FL0804]|nr:hypothetical protein GGR56DRAFT_254529 [Xylariaceae sp. FL0804]
MGEGGCSRIGRISTCSLDRNPPKTSTEESRRKLRNWSSGTPCLSRAFTLPQGADRVRETPVKSGSKSFVQPTAYHHDAIVATWTACARSFWLPSPRVCSSRISGSFTHSDRCQGTPAPSRTSTIQWEYPMRQKTMHLGTVSARPWSTWEASSECAARSFMIYTAARRDYGCSAGPWFLRGGGGTYPTSGYLSATANAVYWQRNNKRCQHQSHTKAI